MLRSHILPMYFWIRIKSALPLKTFICVLISLSTFLVGNVGFCELSEESEHDVEKIIEHIDNLYRSTSSHAEMEMHIVTPHYERTLNMLIWTKGMDKTFIRILSPKKERGVSTLRINNEMWNYLPKVNKTIKISPSMMMGSWMGSDFTNDDLVKESSMIDDYTYQLITPDDADTDLVYIQLVPKEDTSIVWGKIIAAVRKKDYTPIWQHFYDEKDKLMRILNFKEIKTFGSKTIPSVMEMIPQNKEGHKTVVRWLNATFDSNINDNIFSRRNLQKRM